MYKSSNEKLNSHTIKCKFLRNILTETCKGATRIVSILTNENQAVKF